MKRQLLFTDLQRRFETAVRQVLARAFISVLDGVVLRAHLVVEVLKSGSALGGGGVVGLPAERHQPLQLGQRGTHLAVLPGFHRFGVELVLLLTRAHEFLFAPVYFGHQFQRPDISRLQFQHVLNGLPGVAERALFLVLVGQAQPVFDLLLAAPVLDGALQRERRSVRGIHRQQLLEFLERQRIFLLFRPCTGAVEQLGDHSLALRIVDATPQRCDCLVDVAFHFQLGQDLVGELVISLLEGLPHAFDARLYAGRIEHLERLVAGRLLERFGELPRTGKPIPGLLRHGLVDDAADHPIDQRVQLGGRRRDVFHDGRSQLRSCSTFEGVP